ncbi:hypothetical protein [uncultured Zhongshania sp.]|nr:hypothetical protein [uncultured Zhongshania sp.]
MAPYQYLAEAQPCGCDVVIYEDQCTLDTLKDFGTGLTGGRRSKGKNS